MTPELEKFITLATRPLEGRDEQRDEARGELMARLGQRGVPVEMIDVSGPTGRLASARPFPEMWRRGIVLGSLLLLVGLFLFGLWRDGAMLARTIYASNLSWKVRSSQIAPATRFEFFFYDWLDRRAPDLPISGREGELEALRRENPEDLALLQEALVRRSIRHDEFMTAAERDLVRRLDPDNALWPTLEMNWEFHKAVGEDPYDGFYYGSSHSPDPTASERGWKRYAEVVKLDRFHSYGLELAMRQGEAYAEKDSVLDGLIRLEMLRVPRVTRSRMRYYFSGSGRAGFGGALIQKIDDLRKGERREELRDLYHDWRQAHLRRIDAAHPDGWALQAFSEDISAAAGHFASAFAALDMKLEEKEAGDISARAAPGGHHAYTSPGAEAGMRLQAGSWGGVNATPEEMRPGRMADMAMFHRLLSWPLVLIALAFVLMWGFEACRRSPTVKGTARGLTPLLTRFDHILIGVLGILVPWVYWWVLTRFTPVGISDKVFADDEWIALAWVLQIAIGMVLGLVALTHVVQWRWAKVGGFLGLAGHVPWLGWVVIALVAASLPAAGLIRFLPLTGDDEKGFFLLGCAATGSIGLLWLLWVGIMNLCTSRGGALRPNLVARTMITWSLAGFASLLLAVGFLRMAEGWWYRQDPLLPGGTSEHYVNALEEREVMQHVKQIRETLDVSP